MEVERERLKLKDNPKLISPPSVAPAWQCGTVVLVKNFLASATLDIELNGSVVVAGFPVGYPVPNGALVPLASALITGQKIRARQAFGGLVSDWSTQVTVKDHLTEFPAGLPRPQINPSPVFKCGTRTGVANLLVGCDVWIDADAVEVGRVKGAKDHQGVNVAPPYGLGQKVVAHASLCGDQSPPSATEITQPPPSVPLPAPIPGTPYEGGTQVTIDGVVNGATLTLSRNGVVQFSFSSWGVRHHVGLNPPFVASEHLSVTQRLCPGDPESPPGDTVVEPCNKVPAPGVEPIQAGDTSVRLNSFVPDARIQVYVNGTKQGDAGGPVVGLAVTVESGDVVHVLQIVGTCVGHLVQELTVRCVAPPIGYDPSGLDLFPVGSMSYDAGSFTVTSGHSQLIAGTIYYPANADGTNVPFNTRLAALGRVPVAVLVHGRHGGSTSHLGYDYFQVELARMGIIAMSVDCNASDGWGGWADNIRDRADLVIASIKHLQSLDGGGDAILGGRVDFTRVALMGHSRGGDAVGVVPEIITLPGVKILGAISLGPVNSGAWSTKPKGYAYMTILPASDGDVVDNNGAQFYDGADPSPFKCQLYVDHANHNFFNRQWLNDDARGLLPLISRADHERILSAYGCAFFRNVVLGHDTLAFLDGRLRPPGVLTAEVHLSFKRVKQFTVDDHQDGNTIAKNSLSQPTSQTGGLVAGEHTFDQFAADRFNPSFFGATVGMVARSKGKTGTFRSPFSKPRDVRKSEVWVRAGEAYETANLAGSATGFLLGLEDVNGAIAWVDSDGVGGLPRPLDRRAFDGPVGLGDLTKTMPNTFRFPARCFKSPPRTKRRFDPTRVVAVLLRMNRSGRRAIAFDDLQIVKA